MNEHNIDDLYPEFNKTSDEILREAQLLFVKVLEEKYSVKESRYQNSINLKQMMADLSSWDNDKNLKELFVNKVKDGILEAKIQKLVKNNQKFDKDACKHDPLFVSKKYGENTGNYDPSADCSWIDYQCHLCNKRWTTGQ